MSTLLSEGDVQADLRHGNKTQCLVPLLKEPRLHSYLRFSLSKWNSETVCWINTMGNQYPLRNAEGMPAHLAVDMHKHNGHSVS